MFSEDYIPQEVLSWDDVDQVIDHLLPQFNAEYDAIVMITRGGLFPGGLLSEAMGIKNIHTAAVHFTRPAKGSIIWPTFIQFPIDALITQKRLLVVDDIWAQGVNMVAVKGRLEAAGAIVETAVLHFRPKANLFPETGPDYYGAITSRYIIYPWNTPSRFSNPYPTYRPQPPSQLG